MRCWPLLLVIGAVYCGISALGISWGLPSRDIDPYLFGDGEVWSGEKIYRLAKAGDKFSTDDKGDEGNGRGQTGDRGRDESQRRGADVDVDPIARGDGAPISLTATDEDVAKIYLRYRLYTYQPDEMITMMSLAGMRPSMLQLDPKLYQYGGLFIYPVGALIKLCGMVGLIDVRGDVVYYLDHPDEFGKFYIVARAYSTAWGLVGVFVVFAIGRRVADECVDLDASHPPHGREGRRNTEGGEGQVKTEAASNTTLAGKPPVAPSSGKSRGAYDAPRSMADSGRWAGVLAAMLFAVMPVVVCMSHEGKPHLPGAVLMLMAVLFAMRCVSWRVQTGVTSLDTPVANRCHTRPGTVLEGENLRKLKRAARGVDWWMMCVCCGAAFGMVLSSWPIFVLIPLVAWLTSAPPHPPLGKGGRRNAEDSKGQVATESASSMTLAGKPPVAPARQGDKGERVSGWFARTTIGVLVGVAVYLFTNPYIAINLMTNRDVLASNFGNSLAMYDVSRIVEGFARVIELTIEGATLPILILGTLAMLFSLKRRSPIAMVIVVPAAVFFLQFVLIGAGKPAEYGRFGIFPNTALAIGAACFVSLAIRRFVRTEAKVGAVGVAGAVLSVSLISWTGLCGWGYLEGFMADASEKNSRVALASSLSTLDRDPQSERLSQPLGTFAEPAPYCYPPIDFAHADVRLIPFPDEGGVVGGSSPVAIIAPLETTRTPTSWANKDFFDSRNGVSVSRNAIPLGR
jgi:hypothetical protein